MESRAKFLREARSLSSNAQADLRSKVPPMVLIYPIDQGYFRSIIVRRQWMLKLCCMAPGEEHPFNAEEDGREGETNPALGWYRLEDYGVLTGPILRWAKKHEAGIKFISKRLGKLLESIKKDDVTSFIKTVSDSTSDIAIPEKHLPSGGGKYLSDSSGITRLTGLNENEYLILEGQALVFLQRIFDKHQPCGNLYPLSDGILWVCKSHLEKLKSESLAYEKARADELWAKYLEEVERRVNTVYILGDSVPHELKDVFVELTIIGERERPTSQAQIEYLGLMDSELRKLRNPILERGDVDTQELPRDRKVQPEELLRPHTRTVIAGAPGSGKSTLLRHIAYKTLKGKERLPVFLELKTIENGDFDYVQGNLLDLLFARVIANSICETDADRVLMRKEFYEKLKAGNVSIFLDGLDEVSGEEFFGTLRRSVINFLTNADYRQSNLYISTRPYALLDQFGRHEVQEMEIAPFNREQINRFISYYYPGDLRALEFSEELKHRPELRELASVPALLGFLILLYRRPMGNAPSNRLELYNDVVHLLISEWDREKGARREFETSETVRKDFLSNLAFSHLFSGSGQELSRNLIFTSQDILREAGRYCQLIPIATQADVLADEVIFTPLLRQVGTDTYAFTHLTIQEYLAAMVLAERADCERIFCKSYFDPTLVEMEVLPMILGKAGHQNDLYKAIERLPESLDFKNLRLTARSLKYGPAPDHLLTKLISILRGMVTGDDVEAGYFNTVVKSFRTASRPTSESIANSVAEELRNEEEIYREYAVRILGLLGSEAAIQSLHKALKDTDSSVRIKAKLYLGANGDASIVESLMKELEADDTNVKEEVIYALQQIGTEEAIDGIKKAVDDDDYFVRKRSLETLAWLCGEEAIPILTKYLNDPEDFVRRAVVTELGDIGGEKVIDPLIEATKDSNSSVAKQAFTSLGQIGGDRVYQYLTEYLTTHSGELIGHAAEALGQIGNTNVIPNLVELLDQCKNEPPTEEVPFYFLTGWVKDFVRVRIAAALCRLGEKHAQRVLIESLEKGMEVNYAAKALSYTGGDEAKPFLINMLEKYKGEDNSIAIAKALSNLEVDDADQIAAAMISVLGKYKGSSYESLKVGALNVLGQAGGELAIKGLINALEDSHPFVQLSAIAMLGNIALKDETAVPGLVNRL